MTKHLDPCGMSITDAPAPDHEGDAFLSPKGRK